MVAEACGDERLRHPLSVGERKMLAAGFQLVFQLATQLLKMLELDGAALKSKSNPKRKRGNELGERPRSRFLKFRFWLPHEDFNNPTRKRVDVNLDISSLTRRVMKKAQLQSSRFGLPCCWRRGQVRMAASGPEGASHHWGLTLFPARLEVTARRTNAERIHELRDRRASGHTWLPRPLPFLQGPSRKSRSTVPPR